MRAESEIWAVRVPTAACIGFFRDKRMEHWRGDGCGRNTGREEPLIRGGTGHHPLYLPYPSPIPQNPLFGALASNAAYATT